MKKHILLFVAVVMAMVNVAAQRIKTVDTDGNPVSYATVSDVEAGRILGYTDMQGELADVGGAKTIAITHVAFKSKVLSSGSIPNNGVIVLQDGDYDLPEITITKKDYIYVQTYYRLLYMDDDTLVYYRSGLTDNAYDIQRKKLSTSHSHFSKATVGIIKFTLDRIIGGRIDNWSAIPTDGYALGRNDDKIVLTRETPTRQRINYGSTCIGFMVDDMDDHQRRISIDNGLYTKLYWQDHRSQRKNDKKAKRDEKRRLKNETSTRYMVFRLDDEGNSGIEDFVMKQVHLDYDSYSRVDKKDEHRRMWVEVYVTDRAFVSKDELKARKRANRVKMDYQSLRQFEKDHNIPPMPDMAIKELEKLSE